MTNLEVQIKKADEFLKLHHDHQILLLPNAWDVISAKMYEQYGFEAIGTTSAGISATLGYPDGQVMKLEENLSVVKKIAENTHLPVSADIEAGYSTSIEGVIRAAKSALDAGAIGINLEDSTGDDTKPFFEISQQVEKIKAIRQMAESEKIHLVLNLRTDVYMLGKGGHKQKFAETILRANIYSESGADCIFVPDTGDFNEKIIGELVKEIKAPLNIIAGRNIPPVQKLEEIGVARLSFGPRALRAMLSLLCKIQKELLEKGTYELMSDERITYKEINQLLQRK